MRNQRTDRSRAGEGPLTSHDVQALFERGYSLASRRYIAEAWGIDPESNGEAVAKRLDADRINADRLEEVTPLQRATMSQVAASGGRMRGENLRRDLLLRGFGDTEDTLRELVERALLIPLPNPGESELDIDSLLEQESFLQRDLAVTTSMREVLAEEAESFGPAALGSWSGEIEQITGERLDDVELNLLHLSSLLQHEPLRLNKSGTPNRRSLGRFARGLSLPGTTGAADDDIDLNDAVQLDYVTFLLALGIELRFFTRDDQRISATFDPVEDYFCAEPAKRHRMLVNAFQSLKFWNEVESLALSRGTPGAESDEHFSQFEPTGEPLIGARGYVLSVLRRSRIGQWTPLEAVIDLCAQLDRSYLPRALSKADPPVEPRAYIEAVLCRALPWMGLLEHGRSEDGVKLVRATPAGRHILGLKTPEGEEPTGPPPGECLVVQPNFEVMLFLQPAPLKVVYRLYQVGQREKLSDKVANFRLTAESVQWGYGHGLNSSDIVSLLDEYSHAPVPDTVSFQLEDWERVHKKLTLYASGVLLRHPDPERLDLIIGQLEHEHRNMDVDTVRLGPNSAFVATLDPPGLERVEQQEDHLRIDYLGEVPPSLYFVDLLEIMIDPMETDIVTLGEIGRIADALTEDSTPRAHFYRLNVDKIRKRWPDDTLAEVISFLDVRTEGGIPSAQALKLRSMLDKPLEVDLSRNVTVVVLENEEVADHFGQIPECEDIIEARLGDRAFSIKTGHEDELEEILEELGIVLA